MATASDAAESMLAVGSPAKSTAPPEERRPATPLLATPQLLERLGGVFATHDSDLRCLEPPAEEQAFLPSGGSAISLDLVDFDDDACEEDVVDGLWRCFASPPQALKPKDGSVWQAVSLRLAGEGTVREVIRRSGRAPKRSHWAKIGDQIDGTSDRPRSANWPRSLPCVAEEPPVPEEDELPPPSSIRFDRTRLGGHPIHAALRSRGTPASAGSSGGDSNSGEPKASLVPHRTANRELSKLADYNLPASRPLR